MLSSNVERSSEVEVKDFFSGAFSTSDAAGLTSGFLPKIPPSPLGGALEPKRLGFEWFSNECKCYWPIKLSVQRTNENPEFENRPHQKDYSSFLNHRSRFHWQHQISEILF